MEYRYSLCNLTVNSRCQLNRSCVQFQSEVFRAAHAEPEVLDSLGGCWESEESTSIHSHEQSGAARIGALGNHQLTQENIHLFDAEEPDFAALEAQFFSHHAYPSELLFPELNRGNFSDLYEVASGFQ